MHHFSLMLRPYWLQHDFFYIPQPFLINRLSNTNRFFPIEAVVQRFNMLFSFYNIGTDLTSQTWILLECLTFAPRLLQCSGLFKQSTNSITSILASRRPATSLNLTPFPWPLSESTRVNLARLSWLYKYVRNA